MATAAVVPGADVGVARGPRPVVLGTVGLAGCAAAAAAFALTLRVDAREPGVHAALVGWITLSYVLCGLVAWWRRPDSRFGLLMVAAGFGPLLSKLVALDAAAPHTIGLAFESLPPVLFLHLFLAYPSGRLQSRFERALVAAAYVASVGLALVRMLLDGVGPGNLLAAVEHTESAEVVRRLQAVALSALALTAIGVLAARRRGAGRPLRRSRELLVYSFALALVMIAIGILVAHYFRAPWSEQVRWVGFSVIGFAPVVFLFGLLRARLARSAVGDLLVELRAEPAPLDLQDALARALGDPSLELAFWLPEFGSYADLEGRAVELPGPELGRQVTFVERDGARVGALLHDSALDEEPELLDAVTAAAGIALENGRLHAELRARLEELKGSRARVIEAGQQERQRLERDLHDGAQQRLIALSLELGLLEERLDADFEARRRLDRAREEIATSLEEL